MTPPQITSTTAPAAIDSVCGGTETAGSAEVAVSAVSDVLVALAALPLRERAAALRMAAGELFDAVNAPAIEWGDDAALSGAMVTVDDELAGLHAERGALVEVIADVVALTRSLDASVRVLADQHARVVSRFDVLDADQLERRLSAPATALAGEFACDDFAPLLGLSPTVAARWAETGSELRARYPHLLALAGRGVVRMRACEVVASELAHLEPEHSELIEDEFLTGDAVHGSEASIRKQLRRLLDHHGLARPREVDDEAARIGLGFTEIPEQPTLTELNVTLIADDAWRLNAAIEARAQALIDEWAQAHGPDDAGYPIRRARVDALLDLALGHVRFVPEVRISVPVTVRAAPARFQSWASPVSFPSPQALAPWFAQQAEGACLVSAHASVCVVPEERVYRSPAARSDLDAVSAAVRATPTGRGVVPACDVSRDGTAGIDANLTAGTMSIGTGNSAVSSISAPQTSVTSRKASSSCAATARHAVADLDVPHIGRVSAEALIALGETLGAHVTVALADADSGVTAWTSATTYRPGLSMRRFVETRDAHCRFPGCMRPAPMCDVDHVTPHAQGGATSPANLQLLCRHHHRAKTHGAWAVAMTSDGTCVWQSPVGDWFRTHPGDATAHRITPDEAMDIADRAKGSQVAKAEHSRPAA